MSVIEIITVSAALAAAVGAWCTPCINGVANLAFDHINRVVNKYSIVEQKQESHITTNSKMVCYFEKDKSDLST